LQETGATPNLNPNGFQRGAPPKYGQGYSARLLPSQAEAWFQ